MVCQIKRNEGEKQKMKDRYPRPQFERNSFMNLNGWWTCHISRKAMCYRNSDIDEERVSSKGFENRILVPFAPETPASGMNVQDIIDCIYYHRTIQCECLDEEKRAILNFGAVFYHCEVYIDGIQAGFHDGGSSSFSIDITAFVKDGEEHDLVVKATSNLQDGSIPSGKQSSYMTSYTCFYHRTTGIWQTVWIEIVNRCALENVRTVWNAGSGELYFTPSFRAVRKGLILESEVISPEGDVFTSCVPALQNGTYHIRISKPDLWEPDHPALYTIKYRVKDGEKVIDEVSSYTGLRDIRVEGNMIYLNGKKLYQRLVLDQGFYPESNWTSPSDEALENDIRLSMAAGFNGARLHQKVFEERFFYHADRLGYLVWAESPSWGLDYNNEGLAHRNFLSEWAEIVVRDLNHPSIIAWTPLNETFYFRNPLAHRRLHKNAYEICRMLDPSRPVNDASGYIHYMTDLWTVHTYVQDPEKLAQQLEKKDGMPFRNYPQYESEYSGQPYLVDEYGGIKWDPETQGDKSLSKSQNLTSWGYGDAVHSEEEFFTRLEKLTDVILSMDHICGYCYTQLTDVEQEKNGVYFYDRSSKFDTSRFRHIFSRKPDGYDI